MIMDRERFLGLLNGKPGALIDEEIPKDGGVRLIYTYHDECGHLVCLFDQPRNAAPEDFTRCLNKFSDDLLHDLGVPEKEAVERAKLFRELAKEVPGYRKR